MIAKYLLAAAAAVALAAPTLAQDYPTRPIRFIVPTAAGGASDIVARIIADKIQISLGQPVVVEARPGANGNIGAELVLNQPADGYTLMMGHIGVMSINNQLYPDVKFNPVRDFEPVVNVVSYANVLIVNPKLPVNTVAELISYAKANQGKLNYGSPGFGGSLHMGMEMFKAQAGVDIVHVPYQGAGPALSALLAGDIQVSFSDPLATLPQVKAGSVRALAVSGARRLVVAPEIPTVAETGLPGYDVQGWVGVAVKTGTPKEHVAKLNEHVNRALAMPEVRQNLIDKGAEINGGTPEQFATFIRGEYERWGNLIRTANLKLN